MNIWLIVSGVLALFVVVGHFSMGRKNYLKPMLDASFDGIAKRVMQSVFHYISVNLVLMTILLLAAGFGLDIQGGSAVLVKFVAIHFALYAIIQIILAATAKIEKAFMKMFQWLLFLLIALFAWLGAM
jgi:hypothetical protein